MVRSTCRPGGVRASGKETSCQRSSMTSSRSAGGRESGFKHSGSHLSCSVSVKDCTVNKRTWSLYWNWLSAQSE